MLFLQKREEWANKYEKIGEKFFLLTFITYLIGEFITGTMLPYVINDSIAYLICTYSTIFAVIKILLFNKFDNWREFALTAMTAVFIWACSFNANTFIFIYVYIMIVAAQNVDFKKILSVFLVVNIIGLIVAFVLAKFGIIAGITNVRDGSYELRYALGMVYPTDLAARIFYLELFYMVLRKFRLTIPEYISLFTIAVWTNVVTDTRLDFILTVFAILVVMFWAKLILVFKRLNHLVISFLAFCGIFAIILITYIYTPKNLILNLVNKVLSGRLVYSHKAFKDYNVTLFGQWIPQRGNGGLHHGHFDYFFIDSSYIRILMMNGAVCFILTLIVILYLSQKFMEQKMYVLEIALIFALLSSIIDQHLLELSFNCMPLALLANTNYFKQEDCIRAEKSVS